MITQEKSSEEVREFVRERYGKIAETFQSEVPASCCGPANSDCCSGGSSSVIQLYENADALHLPDEVTGLSLGCGDPVTLASLQAGQVVLDLGSGGGIDCFLAAEKVGPSGRVIGVDMTPAMLEKARANREKIGAENVEFRLGEIEHVPVADATVDVIISNCVINLSPDKAQVMREAYRVLKPGGKLAVSDIVTDGPLPEAVKSDLAAWAGCVAGALDVKDYIAMIEAAGFESVSITPVYFSPEMVDEAMAQLDGAIQRAEFPQEALYKTVFSAKITARKPI